MVLPGPFLVIIEAIASSNRIVFKADVSLVGTQMQIYSIYSELRTMSLEIIYCGYWTQQRDCNNMGPTQKFSFHTSWFCLSQGLIRVHTDLKDFLVFVNANYEYFGSPRPVYV